MGWVGERKREIYKSQTHLSLASLTLSQQSSMVMFPIVRLVTYFVLLARMPAYLNQITCLPVVWVGLVSVGLFPWFSMEIQL